MAKTAPIYCVTVQEFRSSLQVPLGYSLGVCKAVFLLGAPGENPLPHIFQLVEVPTLLGSWPLPPTAMGESLAHWITLTSSSTFLGRVITPGYLDAMDGMFVSLAKPYIEVLTPDGIVVGSGAFGK